MEPPEDPEEIDIERALRVAISSELEAINQYDMIVAATQDQRVKDVLGSIRDEEKVHVGELTTLLFTLSPIDRSFFEDGKEETLALLRPFSVPPKSED